MNKSQWSLLRELCGEAAKVPGPAQVIWIAGELEAAQQIERAKEEEAEVAEPEPEHLTKIRTFYGDLFQGWCGHVWYDARACNALIGTMQPCPKCKAESDAADAEMADRKIQDAMDQRAEKSQPDVE